MDQRNAYWRQFVGGLPADRRLGQVFLESWRGVQVEAAGEDRGSKYPAGSPPDRDELPRRLEENRELLNAARPNFDWTNLVLGHISHLVYLIDRDGIVLHAAGNDPEKMAKLRLIPGYDWSEAARGRNGAGTALAENRPVAVVGPDRFTHPLDDCTWTGAPVHGPGGTLVGAVGITTCADDGTPDRLVIVSYLAHRIEQDLIAEPAGLLEAIAGPLSILDARCRFIALNREAERLLGRTREELLGRTPWEIAPEFIGTTLERQLQKARATGTAVDFETFFRHANAWHVVHAWPSPSGLVIHSHDVTDRKRVEEKLRASEERHRLIAELATDFTYVVGVNPDGSSTVEAASPGFFRIFGSTFEELNARGWVDFVYADDRLAAREGHRRLLAGQVVEQEVRSVTKEGAVRWIRSVSRPVWNEAHDRVIRIVGAGQDVTDRRLAEEALKEAERRKDEFLAMLAHELRNPLAPIRNSLHSIKAEVAGTPIESAQAMMERQVDRLARLVDDLLEVSRITRGTIELRKEVVDLADSVRRAVESIGPLLERRHHRFTLTMPDRPVLVEGDPVRLEQVLDNLLDNAIKYTEPGGTIELEVRHESHLASIRVRDTGIGIAAEMLPHIFDLFIQAERLLVQSYGGLGIGLSLVRHLVEMHGGSVSASSGGLGLGSEFLVHLPALSAAADGSPETRTVAAPSHRPAASLAPKPSRRRILVVDDNVDSARSMASLLSRLWDQTVAVAYDAASALELADTFQPEVVLLDIGLPGPSGYELARRLREHPRFRKTLLIAMSGWGREEDLRRSREAGINYHLVKPIAPMDLEFLLTSPEPPAFPS